LIFIAIKEKLVSIISVHYVEWEELGDLQVLLRIHLKSVLIHFEMLRKITDDHDELYVRMTKK